MIRSFSRCEYILTKFEHMFLTVFLNFGFQNFV